MTSPIDMLLWCPRCHEQHIDIATAEWTNPPHRSHLCLYCKTIWRPALVETNGVAALPAGSAGSADNWPVQVWKK